MNGFGSSRRRLALALVALAIAAMGCGAAGTTSGPNGDTGGNHLVTFVSDRGGGGVKRLYLYDLDEFGFRALRNIGTPAADAEPCLSGDGRFLAYTAPGPAAGDTDVAVYDRQDERVIVVPGLNTTAPESWPRFTDDGLKLAFVRDSAGIGRVRLYESLGDTLIRLSGLDAPGAASDFQPSPNTNGQVIAFTSDRTGKRHVYVWESTTGALRNVPALIGDDDDHEPSLSPDGRWLAFSTKRSGGAGGWDVMLYDFTAGALVGLPGLNSGDDEQHPSISRDGSVIAFTSSRPSTSGGASDVYFYFRSDSTVRVPNGLTSAGDDRQPFLRWR